MSPLAPRPPALYRGIVLLLHRRCKPVTAADGVHFQMQLLVRGMSALFDDVRSSSLFGSNLLDPRFLHDMVLTKVSTKPALSLVERIFRSAVFHRSPLCVGKLQP